MMTGQCCGGNSFPRVICPTCGMPTRQIAMAETIEAERIFSDMLCSGASITRKPVLGLGELSRLLNRNPEATYYRTKTSMRIQVDGV